MAAGFPFCLFTCSLNEALATWILKGPSHLILCEDAHTWCTFLFLRQMEVKQKRVHYWSYIRILPSLLLIPEAGP